LSYLERDTLRLSSCQQRPISRSYSALAIFSGLRAYATKMSKEIAALESTESSQTAEGASLPHHEGYSSRTENKI
jgi:hypothetical protein